MKFKLACLLVIAVMISLFVVQPAQAQGPAGDWASGISCQNQDTTNAASITLTFYEADTGTVALSYSDTIAAGKSKNYYTPSSPPGLPSNFLGSLVVSSSTPLTCALENNETSTGSSSSPYRYGASKGFAADETGPTVYVSQIEKDFYGWNSYMAIQNTGGSSVNVTVTYVDRFGHSYGAATENFAIPSMSNHVVYLESNANIPSNFIGGATISADDGTTPLAVTAVFYNDAEDSAQAQIHAYNGATTGSDTLYAPYVVRSYYGYNSGIMVQNVGASPTSFKITFTFGGQNFVYQYPSNLQPGEVKDFYLPNVPELSGVDALSVPQRFGKAIIEATDLSGTHNATGSLISNINQSNLGGAGIPAERAGQGSTYGAFLSTGGSQTIYIAKFMDSVGGIFSSGFNVSNYSGSDGTCDITFVDDADAKITGKSIQDDSFFSMYGPNIANLDDGYNAGVIIECTVDVFVITNASANPGSGKYGDSFYQMNAGTE